MKQFIFFTVILSFFIISCNAPNLAEDQSYEDESSYLIDDSENPCIIQDTSVDCLSIVNQAYSYLFSGNIQSFVDCVADDVVWIHYGPTGTIPVYNTYYGKEGVMQWANTLFTSVQMNYFDIHYFVVEGNRVHTQVKEGAYSYGSLTQMYIENFHSFEINSQGKISKLIVIAESYTGVSAYFGESGKTYNTKYENSDYFSNYKTGKNDELKVLKLMKDIIANGRTNNYKKYFSQDAEIVLTGPDDIVPFMGKFTGENGIRAFIKKYSKDICKIDIKYIIKQNNKINVYFKLYGISSNYKKPFKSEANFSFQFNDGGKIERIYGYSDNYTISRSYIN